MPDITRILMEELDKERNFNRSAQDNKNRREVRTTLAFYGLTLKDVLKEMGITRQGFYYKLDNNPTDAIEDFRETVNKLLNSKE